MASHALTTELVLEGWDDLAALDQPKQWALVKLLQDIGEDYGVPASALTLEARNGKIVVHVTLVAAADDGAPRAPGGSRVDDAPRAPGGSRAGASHAARTSAEKALTRGKSRGSRPRDGSSAKLPSQSSLPAPRERLTVIRQGTRAKDHGQSAWKAPPGESVLPVLEGEEASPRQPIGLFANLGQSVSRMTMLLTPKRAGPDEDDGGGVGGGATAGGAQGHDRELAA